MFGCCLEWYHFVENGPIHKSLVLVDGSAVCTRMLDEAFDDLPQLLDRELAGFDALSGSLDVVVVSEDGHGVWYVVFVVEQIQTQA